MLVELTVENIAVIERAEFTLGSGFTAVTGETGAGKSLLVDSVALCLGERADADIVRTGAPKGVVFAVFEPGQETTRILEELGYAGEDGLLYIQREIAAEGRSQCRINGRLAPLSALKRVGDTLADLHGQHEHQSLLAPTNHLDVLDAWIGHEALNLRESISTCFSELQSKKRQLRELEQSDREREQRLDILRFQVGELEGAALQPGEILALEEELLRLKNAETLAASLESASNATYSGETTARDLLAMASKEIEAASEFDHRLESTAALLRASLFSLEDAIIGLRESVDQIEFDNDRIEVIAGRLDTIAKLRRKYGDTEQDMLHFLEQARESLNLLENATANREELAADIRTLEIELQALCDKLTTIRSQGASGFCELVAAELHDLAMAGARFSANLSTKAPEADGADSLEFLFSANTGEAERPLAKIASGGEISRVMLAVKTIMAGKGGVPTLVFDEVDTGLGGQTAAIVARKLEQLAENYQVIVVTHVPQIAGRATTHFAIEKVESGGRVATRARRLTSDQRVDEIARMLAGETVSQAAVENAKSLLACS
jgi:DNA repair protein RecN (Recombination protein N)